MFLLEITKGINKLSYKTLNTCLKKKGGRGEGVGGVLDTLTILRSYAVVKHKALFSPTIE